MKHKKVSQPSTFWIVEFGNQSFRSYFVVFRHPEPSFELLFLPLLSLHLSRLVSGLGF